MTPKLIPGKKMLPLPFSAQIWKHKNTVTRSKRWEFKFFGNLKKLFSSFGGTCAGGEGCRSLLRQKFASISFRNHCVATMSTLPNIRRLTVFVGILVDTHSPQTVIEI